MREVFLQLVRIGIGTGIFPSSKFQVPGSIDWTKLKAFADAQGLSAVVLDGLDKCNVEMLPLQLKLKWIGDVLQNYEHRYKSYENAISSLAGFYHQHEFKMMLLKGYACSLDWPKPEHRPCGDIDIWQFGEYQKADGLLRREKGIVVDNSHQHHTVFYWNNFMVENHYDFINVHHRKSGPKLEAIFKELGKDDSNCMELYGEKIYLPSVNLHALFLIYHTMLHFTSTEMSIRQILDWALFVKAHTNEIEWDWLLRIVDESHLRDFLNILNAICVEDLGFDSNIFPYVQFDPELKERVLNDIFAPEFTGREPSNLLRRIFFKYRRWKSHEWKHHLCFEETMWSIFRSEVWGHLLKPKSI